MKIRYWLVPLWIVCCSFNYYQLKWEDITKRKWDSESRAFDIVWSVGGPMCFPVTIVIAIERYFPVEKESAEK